MLFYGLSGVYLLGVVVQFFLAGMGAFGATDYDAHRSLGFILGIFGIFALFGTVDFGKVFTAAATNPSQYAPWMTLVCLCLFLGAVGKSAQVPLHVWLPDAMAGPTPVSALIHAATMVTAGVYMVARCNVLFRLAPSALLVVAIVGGFTALFAAGDTLARAAAMMSGTRLVEARVLGAAWPRHFNRPLAEAMHTNIRRVGIPTWTAEDVALARAVQQEVGGRVRGLDTAVTPIGTGVNPDQNPGGGSDDIGDVSWVVPTITLRYPSNIPGLPGHHWSNAIAMATPIAHKGATAGAKAMAMTILDLIASPALVDSAAAYFRDVQTKDVKYSPLIRPTDKPPIEMNEAVMARFRPEMRRFYYNPGRYRTYLEQLGIRYPTVRSDTTPPR